LAKTCDVAIMTTGQAIAVFVAIVAVVAVCFTAYEGHTYHPSSLLKSSSNRAQPQVDATAQPQAQKSTRGQQANAESAAPQPSDETPQTTSKGPGLSVDQKKTTASPRVDHSKRAQRTTTAKKPSASLAVPKANLKFLVRWFGPFLSGGGYSSEVR